MTKPQPYGPKTTCHLRMQWRALANGQIGTHRRAAAAARAATAVAMPRSGRWYAAAVWHYNNH